MARHYVVPDAFTTRVVNPTVTLLTRLGVSVMGSRVLEVRGRRSGVPRRTPVNVLKVGDGHYLVAPRGETQWVRNLRAAGVGHLLLGRRRPSGRSPASAAAPRCAGRGPPAPASP